VLVLLAVAAAAFLGWLIGTGPGGTVVVPDVRGTGPELAEQYLAAAGLDNVAVHETSDPAAPAGTVIGTEPSATAAVRPAEQVVLLVSTGPEQVTVPDLAGLDRDTAHALLAGAGLGVGAVTEVFDDAAPGTVAGQGWPAGTAVPAGSAVDLEVSAGERPDDVPGVLGRPVEEAVRLLEEAGFPVRVEESLGAPFGRVVRQAADGTGVVLTVL
jgi:serine/threonine-protein kinase